MKSGAWGEMFGTARSTLDEAKKLWAKVANRDPHLTLPSTPAVSGAEALSAIDIKIDLLEKKTKLIEDEAASSFEVVRSITRQQSQLSEQHMQLVEAVDGVLAHLRVLQWSSGALALAVVAALVLLLAT